MGELEDECGDRFQSKRIWLLILNYVVIFFHNIIVIKYPNPITTSTEVASCYMFYLYYRSINYKFLICIYRNINIIIM